MLQPSHPAIDPAWPPIYNWPYFTACNPQIEKLKAVTVG